MRQSPAGRNRPQHDVFRPLTQRRDVERHHVETEIEVLAELLLPNHFGKVLVRGGQDTASVDRSGAADADENLLLKHAEELSLPGETEIADLVEKERAIGG